MNVGDLVRIKNLHPDWGKVGTIVAIRCNRNHAQQTVGQISILSNGVYRAIPWYKREHYLEVISASR